MNIKINFQDTIDKANRLEELASDINRVCVKELIQTEGAIRANWKGKGANRYEKKLELVNRRLAGRAKALKKVAGSMERSARNLKRVEELAETFFK